jgi:nicotinamide-nucleotide amidase
MKKTISELATLLGNRLQEQGFTLISAESCTGGGLGFAVTSISGSSAWFDRGFITYTNKSKEELLGVKKETLDAWGAVSEQTAREMAEGALRASHADISIAITGIAGPTGGSVEKPVGTVWIAYASKHQPTQADVYFFSGDRENIREQAIEAAMDGVLKYL